jgi:hypothetical protein
MKKPIAYQFKDSDKADAEAWFLLDANLKAAHKSINEVIEKHERLVSKSPRGEASDLEGDFSHADALFVYAVTMYLRCFATGRRHRLRIDAVPGVSKTDIKTHESLRLLRNRHFAHPVSDEYEGAEILLIVSHDKKQKLGFVCYTVQYVCESLPELRRIERMVSNVLKYVERMGQLSSDKLSRKFFGASAKWSGCQFQSTRSNLAVLTDASHKASRRR